MTKVLLFGRLRDIAGWHERRIEPAPSTLSDLRAVLAGGNEALAEALRQRTVLAAVDDEIVRGDVSLTTKSEVAFMPPLSGG